MSKQANGQDFYFSSLLGFVCASCISRALLYHRRRKYKYELYILMIKMIISIEVIKKINNDVGGKRYYVFFRKYIIKL